MEPQDGLVPSDIPSEERSTSEVPPASSSTSPSFDQLQEQLSATYVRYLRLLSCSWSSHGAARLLSKDLIQYMRPRIHRCSTPLKVRILTSLLYLPDSLREECKTDLCHILSTCETDRDDWVRKLSRLLQPYIATGHINLREIDTETAYRTIKYLDEQRRVSGMPYRPKPPLESTRVFDVTRDVFRDYQAADEAAREKKQGTAPAPVMTTDPYLLTLPSYQLETSHFRATGDFPLLLKDVEAQGLAAMARELRQYEAQQASRRAKRHQQQQQPHPGP